MDRRCLKKFFTMQPPPDTKVQVDPYSLVIIDRLRILYLLMPFIGILAVTFTIMSLFPGVWFEQASTNSTCMLWKRCALEWMHNHALVRIVKPTHKKHHQVLSHEIVEEKPAGFLPPAPVVTGNPDLIGDAASTTPEAECTNPELLIMRSDDSKLPTWQIGCCAFLVIVLAAAVLAVSLIIRGTFTIRPELILFCYHSAGELFFASAVMNTVVIIMFPKLLTETVRDTGPHVPWYSIPQVSFGHEYMYACVGNCLLYLCATLMMMDEIIYFSKCVNHQMKTVTAEDVKRYLRRRIRKFCPCLVGPKTPQHNQQGAVPAAATQVTQLAQIARQQQASQQKLLPASDVALKLISSNALKVNVQNLV